MKPLKIVLGAVLLVVIFVAAMSFTKRPQEASISNSNTITGAAASNMPAAPKQVEGVKVPDGWNSHQTHGMDSEVTVLSRTKELPNSPASEHISISKVETSLSPEDFVPRQGLVGGSLNSPNANWNWGIYQGHKTFSMTLAANGAAQWFVYVFGGDTVYEFTLSPNDQSNPNLEKDRADFWKVITYYSQDASFEKLSREETQNNCKTITIPSGQEPTIQAEPETGYVVASFTNDGKKSYAFFNFNDDLSLCTPSAAKLLSDTKTQMSKK